MSVSSMTGFGRGEAHGRGIKVVAELSVVNRKQFDCHVSLPRELASLEARVHELLHAAIRRGHVKGSVDVAATASGATAGLDVDLVLARKRVAALRQVAQKLNLPDDLTISKLLDWHDVVKVATPLQDADKLQPLVEQAVRAALVNVEVMRRREGLALAKDLTTRFGRLQKLAATIRQRAPQVVKAYRKTLAARLAVIHNGAKPEPQLLARELALFADRCDISEELTRLESHFAQAAGLLTGKESCGRTLDFLCQEFFREINTIGSKANDAKIARLVVAFKSELEAVREQAQNIE